MGGGSGSLIQNSYYDDTEVLEEIGKLYNTNPYKNNNNPKNSIIVSAGGVNNIIKQANKYSYNQIYSNYSSTGLNDFKITSNASLAYLRKVSDKLSVGIELGIFNKGNAIMSDDPFYSEKKQKPQTKLDVNTSVNLCDYSIIDGSNFLGILCRNGQPVSLCDTFTAASFDSTCASDGYVSDVEICNWSDTYWINNLCQNGKPNAIEFCKIILAGAIYDDLDVVCPQIVSDSDYCVIIPGSCIQPPNPGPDPDPCDINPNSCIAPPPGGGNRNPQRIDISSNAYIAYFLANYEIYKGKYLGFATELGIGTTYRDMSLRGYVSGKKESIALAGKAGVVGSLYFTNNLALGIGTHYVYIGEQEFKALGKDGNFQGYDFKIKSDRTITYNLQLRYLF
jgi:hypothetical protein